MKYKFTEKNVLVLNTKFNNHNNKTTTHLYSLAQNNGRGQHLHEDVSEHTAGGVECGVVPGGGVLRSSYYGHYWG